MLPTNEMIEDVNSAGILPDQSMLNFCSTATRLQCRGRHVPSPSLAWYTNRPLGLNGVVRNVA